MATVLMTGGSRGIGFELARQYSAEGWEVHGTVRTVAAARKLVAELGAPIETHIAEMTDLASVRRLSAGLSGRPIDLLICNAGVYQPRDTAFGKTDYDAWAKVIEVNVFAAMATVEALADNVAASDRKLIVMVSSRAGSMAETDGREYVYSSSKAALNSIARSCSAILGERGITVVAVSPGWVRTDMGGANARLDATTAVRSLRDTIGRLTRDDNGKFLDYTGEEIPW